MIDLILNYCGWASLFCLCLNRFGRLKWPGGGKRLLFVTAMMAAVILAIPRPFLHVSLFEVLRGLFAGLSVSTVVLLIALVWRNGAEHEVFAVQERKWLPGILVLVAFFFYPPALGFGSIDPYGWGFDGAIVLPLLTGIAALIAWLSGWRLSALALVLALIAWRLHWLESSNLWDSLFDPLLIFGALLVSARRLLRRFIAIPIINKTAATPE
jgi:hypothetical protein